MKVLIFILVLLFIIPINAQKTVIKEVDFNNQKIKIQLQDIDLLEIVHTDEQKISISMQNYAENPSLLEITDSEKVIAITTSRVIPFQERLKAEKFCYEQPLFPSYKLMLPKGCEISINYINGNIAVDNFNGNLNLRLNTGDVTIDGFKGSIVTELFSGNVNATISNTEAVIITNQGKIRTTFPTNDWEKSDISLKGTLGVQNNSLKVQSINANIVLNNSTTQ